MTQLAKDDNNNAIPALRLKTGGAHTLAANNGTTKNVNAFKDNTKIISLFATVPVYLEFSKDGSLNASTASHYFPENFYYDVAIGDFKWLSITRAGTTDGTLYISEKE